MKTSDKPLIDFKTQSILSQIDNLYRSEGTYGLYDLVYDQLKKDGFEVKYSKEVTNEIWAKAKKKFASENKRIIDKWPEENLKQLLNKYMKSMLVAKWLLEKYKSGDLDGTHFEMRDGDGIVIKLINIVGYK